MNEDTIKGNWTAVFARMSDLPDRTMSETSIRKITTDFDQKGPTIFYIRQNGSGRWDVIEKGYEKALAFFTGKEEALKYANDIAGTKEDASVRVVE